MTAFTHFNVRGRTLPFMRRTMFPTISLRLWGHRDEPHDAEWERAILQDLQFQQVDEDRLQMEARVREMGLLR